MIKPKKGLLKRWRSVSLLCLLMIHAAGLQTPRYNQAAWDCYVVFPLTGPVLQTSARSTGNPASTTVPLPLSCSRHGCQKKVTPGSHYQRHR